MRFIFLVLLSAACAFAEDHSNTPTPGLRLSIAPDLERDFTVGTYDGDRRTQVRHTDAPCVLQARTSPTAGNSLDRPEFRGRTETDAMGPAGLLAACRNLARRTEGKKCKRVFIGGHNGTDSVGVLDLFYLHPRDLAPASLREWQERLRRQPEVSPAETRSRARAMIFDSNGPCYPGPLGPEGGDQGGTRAATEAETRTFGELLDCVGGLLDRGAPEHSLVFSACGPLDAACIAGGRVADTGMGQEVCARLVADALATRVFYSRGVCGSAITTDVYDTCPFGHRVVAPSNWAEIRPGR